MVDGQYFAASRRGYPSNHAPGAQDITLCDVSSGKVYVGRLFNRLHGVRQGEPPTATVDLSTGPSSGFRTSTQVKPSTPPTASAAPEDRSSRRTRTAGSGRAAPLRGSSRLRSAAPRRGCREREDIPVRAWTTGGACRRGGPPFRPTALTLSHRPASGRSRAECLRVVGNSPVLRPPLARASGSATRTKSSKTEEGNLNTGIKRLVSVRNSHRCWTLPPAQFLPCDELAGQRPFWAGWRIATHSTCEVIAMVSARTYWRKRPAQKHIPGTTGRSSAAGRSPTSLRTSTIWNGWSRPQSSPRSCNRPRARSRSPPPGVVHRRRSGLCCSRCWWRVEAPPRSARAPW